MSPASPYAWIGDWIIRETAFTPDEESSHATVFALANGYMGLRGAPEESAASAKGAKGCYVGGVYDTPSGKLTEREMVAYPDWTAMRLSVDGDPFDPATGEVLEWEREIDLHSAVVRRRVRWRSPKGKVIVYSSERLVSMDRPHVGAMKCWIEAETACRIELLTGIDADVDNRWANHFRHVHAERTDPGMLWVECRTFEPGYRIGVASRFGWLQPPAACQTERVQEPLAVWEAHRFALQDGGSCTFERGAAVVDGRFVPGDLRSQARRELHEAPHYDELAAEHIARWRGILEASDIAIDGDPDAQMGIRFSVAHLLMAAPWWRGTVSVPARGLQGQDYYGSIFWDCEIFVFPLLAATQPRAARHALGYRIATLPGARRKAARFGHRGAFYAWQSQESGDDQCDLYVFSDPRTGQPIRSYFCDEQIHISADVAYAFWQYYQATNDRSIWTEGGAEVCAEIARFFVSRAIWCEDDGRYHLTSVLGPDEYHERVNDNAYTNWLAAEAARTALRALKVFEHDDPAGYHAMATRIGLEDAEISGFEAFSAQLFLPQPDPETGLIEQFAGYFGLRDEPVEETRSRLAHPDLHKGGPLGPFQETQNIKQADVIMLLYLLRDRFPSSVKAANWAYYEPRTAHDSSLSPMAYSLVAADIDKIEWAYKYFIYTSHIDLASYGPHWNLGIHAASLGGAWLALVHGFCRVRLAEDAVRLDAWPMLPDAWTRVRVPMRWRDVAFCIEVHGSAVTIEVLGDDPLPVVTPSGRQTIGPMTQKVLV